jgi:hypothetical protein
LDFFFWNKYNVKVDQKKIFLRLFLGLLLGLELLLVEGEFSAFEEGAVGAAVLTGAGGDLGEDTTDDDTPCTSD